ncbi:MAG: hypothetical protein KF709_05260 [Gemmatimonadaceae bacterium]|nr:hypothetical protein [Gemmatimonadaceae bacterium]
MTTKARQATALLDRMPSGFTTRFAPAPTGHLHLGHLVNAIWVWGLAAARGGRVLLRIEDHDRGRCRPEFERSILDDLDWLGLVPDAAGTDDFRRGPTPHRQSDNLARYEAVLRELEAEGRAYPCICSRTEIARANAEMGQPDRAGQEQRYPGSCRDRGLGADVTLARRLVVRESNLEEFKDLRLGPQAQDPPSQCGDVLLRDRAGNFTYQFAVVVDDFDQGVNVVIRGEDLLDSTGRQLRIAKLIGRPAPPRFLHHPLVLHPDGSKLSKSAGDTGIGELRSNGASAAELLGRAAGLAGLGHDGLPIHAQDLAGLFAR